VIASTTWRVKHGCLFFIEGAFVGTLQLLDHHDMATPMPFWLLLPGLLAGAFTPGSGFNLKDDHPWSVLSTLVVYAVNVALYGCLANLLLYRGRSIVLCRKRRTA
jgi:hypothetical protein